jgi:hypothetical protein
MSALRTVQVLPLDMLLLLLLLAKHMFVLRCTWLQKQRKSQVRWYTQRQQALRT